MGLGDLVDLVDVLEALPRVVADGLEEAVAGTRGPGIGDDQRLLDEPDDKIDDVERVEVLIGHDRLCRREPEAAVEDGEAPQHGSFRFVEQLVGPVDGVAQRLVAGGRRPPAAGQEPEAAVEVGDDLTRRHPFGARSSQLDRQWDPIEALAETGDGMGLTRRHREGRIDFRGPVDEQPHGGRLQRLFGRRPGAGEAEGRHGHRPLAGHGEALTAGREHLDPGRRCHDAVNERGDRAEQVLAVVEDQQQPPFAEEVEESPLRGRPRPLLEAKRRHDRFLHCVRGRDRRQFDEPCAIREGRDNVGRQLHGHPCLPDAADAGQREDAGLFQRLGVLDELAFPPDETRRLHGQVPGVAVERAQRRELRRERRVDQLEHHLGLREVAQSMPAQFDKSRPVEPLVGNQ
ncbi:MAG TPA: hypothetical protein VFA84_04000 [Acidimicrobiales bacterium]|nr:hypothetical protein [Acidimicrobiales bacterium]